MGVIIIQDRARRGLLRGGQLYRRLGCGVQAGVEEVDNYTGDWADARAARMGTIIQEWKMRRWTIIQEDVVSERCCCAWPTTRVESCVKMVLSPTSLLYGRWRTFPADGF